MWHPVPQSGCCRGWLHGDQNGEWKWLLVLHIQWLKEGEKLGCKCNHLWTKYGLKSGYKWLVALLPSLVHSCTPTTHHGCSIITLWHNWLQIQMVVLSVSRIYLIKPSASKLWASTNVTNHSCVLASLIFTYLITIAISCFTAVLGLICKQLW